MLLILDLPIYQGANPGKYLLELGLPSDTEVMTSCPDGGIGKHERVIYITSLESGGKKCQKDLILNNRDVNEWLILSEGTETYLFDMFEVSVGTAASVIRLFNNIEDLKKSLNKPAIRKNSCLICTLTENEYTEPFSDLLKKMLPSWIIERSVIGEHPENLEQCTAGTVILLGDKPSDFQLNALPDYLKPIIVLTGTELHPYDYIHKLPQLRSQIFGSISSLKWGESLRAENFYVICPMYEELRIRYEQDSIPIIELKKQKNFVMWDEFGLPMSPRVYDDESFVRTFLSQFDGCKKLAQRLKHA